MPVVISPPNGLENWVSLSNNERQIIFDEAIKKVGLQDFKVFIVAPVKINGYGGLQSTLNDMVYIEAPLAPPSAYSNSDKRAGLDSLAAFHDMFITISHEVLHGLGLTGDHFPMGYGTLYLGILGQNVDSITGREREGPAACDFLATSPDYYSVELPKNLEIIVGQEPSWLIKVNSTSGDCLIGLYLNEYLKDFDKDGEYEIMYANNLIGIELQGFLGWVDIDGDGILEIIDETPYGGLKLKGTYTCSINEECCLNCLDEDRVLVQNGPFSFEFISTEQIGECTFAKIRLTDGKEGLAPLQCSEFNEDIVNLYKGVKYQWIEVKMNYGSVLLARRE